MSRRLGLLIVFMTMVLLVVACGPEMATPTPSEVLDESGSTPTEVSAAEADTPESSPPASEVDTPESPPQASPELRVDADDWHVLGSPEASVTVIEYSDFQ
jgi:hypothetical protein